LLVSEEMQRNLAYCAHEHSQWLKLAVDVALPTQHDAAPSPSAAASLDAAQVEGRRAYALERARDEVLRAKQLVAKWQPLYNELRNDMLVRLLLIDPGFNTLTTMEADDEKAQTAAHAPNDATQVLVMELANGLAMATLECDYNIGYVVA
jgi:hypothetical protein